MCEPVSIALAVTAVTAAASAAMSIQGQQNARKMAIDQEEQKRQAQEVAITEERSRATKDYLRQLRQEGEQARQEALNARSETIEVDRQADQVESSAIASAAERGVDGRSLSIILNDYAFQENREVGILKENLRTKNQQHTENITGYQDQFDQRVTQMKSYVPRPQAPVDYFGPILGAVGTISSGAMSSGLLKPGASGNLNNIGNTTTQQTSATQTQGGRQIAFDSSNIG